MWRGEERGRKKLRECWIQLPSTFRPLYKLWDQPPRLSELLSRMKRTSALWVTSLDLLIQIYIFLPVTFTVLSLQESPRACQERLWGFSHLSLRAYILWRCCGGWAHWNLVSSFRNRKASWAKAGGTRAAGWGWADAELPRWSVESAEETCMWLPYFYWLCWGPELEEEWWMRSW